MPKLLIVGEAWGRHEAEAKRPFVGPSGRLLRALLSHAGINRGDYEVTNCFNLQPRPTNDISNLCGPRNEAGRYPYRLAPGKYLRAEFDNEIDRLWQEIDGAKPNLILALGNIALTILDGGRKASISKSRGTLVLLPRGDRQLKILPTYHPAALLREFSLRQVVLMDLRKAARHMQSPDFARPSRSLWLEPSLEDLARFEDKHIIPEIDKPWGVDIETKSGTITEIGFSRPHIGVVIPFWSRAQADGNYWRRAGDEWAAWTIVASWLRVLRLPIFQNGLYDLNYLARMAIFPRYAGEDTMLLIHAINPESKKGLGFLGSICTDEPSWKFMRSDTDKLKKEDE